MNYIIDTLWVLLVQEDEIGTPTGNVNIPLPSAARINPGHGTRIARGFDGYNY